MSNRTIIPFGPQHPVLPEPIHLDLVMEDETVVEAIPRIGWVHRGLEKLVEKKDFLEMTYVAERICGICSFIHGLTYCHGIEQIMNIEVPIRAHYLRTLWSEFSRIHSHLLWLGLVADAFGFESLFMHSWRIREKVLDIIEATTGGRVIFGSAKVGGTRRDIDNDMLKRILIQVTEIDKEMKEISQTFLNDFSVQQRLKDVGILSKADANMLGAVGPMLRASGVNQDMRKLNYAAYGQINWEPVIAQEGDCYARVQVRVGELFQASDIIRQVIEKIPEGPVDVKVTGMPQGEFFARTEQPRGEVIYYLKGNGTKNLERMRVRTPTFANIPAITKVLPGIQLADVPMMLLTIDPCISCTER